MSEGFGVGVWPIGHARSAGGSGDRSGMAYMVCLAGDHVSNRFDTLRVLSIEWDRRKQVCHFSNSS